MPSVFTISERLPKIFPEGSENRNYLIREMAAKTIFLMLYAGAIDGNDQWIRPDQVTKMTDEQSVKISPEERATWVENSLARGKMKNIKHRWYAVNTRESIRDESLRLGLILVGAVFARDDLPTTSPAPKYCLNADFAKLFDEDITGEALDSIIMEWQDKYLSPEALSRIRLLERGANAKQSNQVLVKLPNGEVRRMFSGPSSVLTKNVIEEFATRFLQEPALVFLSESGNKVIEQDNNLAQSMGLHIEADRNLPDIILADIGLEKPILLFIEVVVTDGPISSSRKEALLNITTEGGFQSERVLFLTAFEDGLLLNQIILFVLKISPNSWGRPFLIYYN